MSWRDVKRKVKQQFSEVLELPSDIILDLPKMVLTGNLQFFLENHRGITAYTPELIRIAAGEGEIEITGQELQLRNILPDELYVEGQIKSIVFLGGKI